jgi:hypothetical protein
MGRLLAVVIRGNERHERVVSCAFIASASATATSWGVAVCGDISQVSPLQRTSATAECSALALTTALLEAGAETLADRVGERPRAPSPTADHHSLAKGVTAQRGVLVIPGVPIPAARPLAAPLLLSCLQDSIAWLATGASSSGGRARGCLARLPRVGRSARFESLGSGCHQGGSVPRTNSAWRVRLGCVESRRVAGGWPRGLRRRFRLAGGRVGPSQLRSGAVGRASLR